MRILSCLALSFDVGEVRIYGNGFAATVMALLLAVCAGSRADDFFQGTITDDYDNSGDMGIDPVDFQQPGSSVRPPSAVRRPSRRPVAGQELAAPSESDTADYLASAPRMFGHYFGPLGQMVARFEPINGTPGKGILTDFPAAGGAGPLQITDNNTPLPQSRFFVNYNHFENALRTTNGTQSIFAPIDQATVGTEQTFFDGISSWQLQLPMTSGFTTPGFATGQIGNLGFISKTSIWRSDYAILSSGFGLDLPTGSSVNGVGRFNGFQIRNTSTTVLPYVGIMALPTDNTFLQGFFTASVPASGNQVIVPQFPGGTGVAGVYTAQTRLHLDLAGGSWLWRNPGSGGLTGLALVGEIHYVAATQSGDFLTAQSASRQGFGSFTLGNLANRQTTTNFTVGVHTVWNDRFQFRIGGAFPLAQYPNRGFDGEVIAQINFIP